MFKCFCCKRCHTKLIKLSHCKCCSPRLTLHTLQNMYFSRILYSSICCQVLKKHVVLAKGLVIKQGSRSFPDLVLICVRSFLPRKYMCHQCSRCFIMFYSFVHGLGSYLVLSVEPFTNNPTCSKDCRTNNTSEPTSRDITTKIRERESTHIQRTETSNIFKTCNQSPPLSHHTSHHGVLPKEVGKIRVQALFFCRSCKG